MPAILLLCTPQASSYAIICGRGRGSGVVRQWDASYRGQSTASQKVYSREHRQAPCPPHKVEGEVRDNRLLLALLGLGMDGGVRHKSGKSTLVGAGKTFGGRILRSGRGAGGHAYIRNATVPHPLAVDDGERKGGLGWPQHFLFHYQPFGQTHGAS